MDARSVVEIGASDLVLNSSWSLDPVPFRVQVAMSFELWPDSTQLGSGFPTRFRFPLASLSTTGHPFGLGFEPNPL